MSFNLRQNHSSSTLRISSMHTAHTQLVQCQQSVVAPHLPVTIIVISTTEHGLCVWIVRARVVHRPNATNLKPRPAFLHYQLLSSRRRLNYMRISSFDISLWNSGFEENNTHTTPTTTTTKGDTNGTSAFAAAISNDRSPGYYDQSRGTFTCALN